MPMLPFIIMELFLLDNGQSGPVSLGLTACLAGLMPTFLVNAILGDMMTLSHKEGFTWKGQDKS